MKSRSLAGRITQSSAWKKKKKKRLLAGTNFGRGDRKKENRVEGGGEDRKGEE